MNKITRKPYYNFQYYCRISNKTIKRVFTSKEGKAFQRFLNELYRIKVKPCQK